MDLIYGNNNYISDRENIVNLHFGLPRHDGQRDDLQLMENASALKEYFNDNPFTQSGPGGINGFMVAMTGLPYCPPTPTANVAAGCYLNASGVATAPAAGGI